MITVTNIIMLILSYQVCKHTEWAKNINCWQRQVFSASCCVVFASLLAIAYGVLKFIYIHMP